MIGKYRNKRVKHDGMNFDSKAELKRWIDLEAMRKAGIVTDLRRQVSFSIDFNDVHICRYIADHVYTMDGKEVVEDVKGYETDVYKLKRKLMLACHDIKIHEIRSKR